MRKHRRTATSPFPTIHGAMLEWVVGGRLTERKGPPPELVKAFETLGKVTGETVQLLNAKEEQRKQQTAGLMQQMMQQRG